MQQRQQQRQHDDNGLMASSYFLSIVVGSIFGTFSRIDPLFNIKFVVLLYFVMILSIAITNIRNNPKRYLVIVSSVIFWMTIAWYKDFKLFAYSIHLQ